MENTSFETLFTRKVHLIFDFLGDCWPIQNTLNGRANGARFDQAIDEKLDLSHCSKFSGLICPRVMHFPVPGLSVGDHIKVGVVEMVLPSPTLT